MKVLDLKCRQAHCFEGWFASETDFQAQMQRGLVQCPLCGDTQVDKQLSVPRLNLGAKAPRAAGGPDEGSLPVATPSGEGGPATLQGAWLALTRKIIANTEDVGDRFAEEARRMHSGEAQERAIRGQASAAEAAQLRAEGIPVIPWMVPQALKETLQ